MALRDPKELAEEIIALERAGLARWGRGDPSGFLEICAPEVTYFDPHLDRRIDGLDRLRQYYESLAGKISIDRYELLNPRVQVHGDVAVLTFNYVSYGRPDSTLPDARWNCTEVYRLIEGTWKIAHTHWSVTQPA
ncbi:MAG: YybH family protein [Planctomycetota bacterium]